MHQLRSLECVSIHRSLSPVGRLEVSDVFELEVLSILDCDLYFQVKMYCAGLFQVGPSELEDLFAVIIAAT